jgi:signal transduction histidine kinase
VIIENLVENSIHFASPVNPKISLVVRDSDEFITMELTDNGHGIDPQLQPRIFDMYFRASHYSKGNGLGLYIVKKAAQKLGGEISLVSELDRGSTFTIVLPRETRLSKVGG